MSVDSGESRRVALGARSPALIGAKNFKGKSSFRSAGQNARERVLKKVYINLSTDARRFA